MANKAKYTPPLFGIRLNILMDEKGYSTPMMCHKLECERKTLYRYLNGESSPDLQTLCKICDIFGVDANYMVGLTNERVRIENRNDFSRLRREQILADEAARRRGGKRVAVNYDEETAAY